MTIAILGGGLAGLSAAYYLKHEGKIQNNQAIQIIEVNNNTGGWIQSWKNEKSKIVTELGPRTIRGRGNSANNTYSLIKDLGIENLVRHVDIDATARYIYAKGNVHQLPTNFWKALFAVNRPFTKPWIHYVLREFFSSNNSNIILSKTQKSDESAYDFFSRTYGQEFADYLISPLLCGVCGGDAKEISVKFMFGALYEAKQKHGSVGFGLLKEKLNTYWTPKKVKNSEETYNFKPPPSVYYLEGGLQVLINALHTKNQSQGINIQLNTECSELHFHENGGLRIMLSNGQHLECSHVISALPAHKLASCVSFQHSKLTQLLNSIPTVSIATVNLTYDNPNVIDSYKGFGVLASPMENLSLLGIIFNNCIYGHKKSVDLTVMMGGYAFKDNFLHNSKCLSNDKLTQIAMDHVKRVLNITLSPTTYTTQVLHNCIPQYTIGHYERVTKIQDYITNKRLPLTLVGSSYTGISINDVIYSSMIAMRKFCRR
ncbi:Protoporphyrinogen oxidase,Amine oxidase,FAD/NAD(P)-binding domain [Cinara cedri]|uniref:Protoporphyrinogen oxidase n=1 Tax=Cinara cedri TaxID=506608 RepID=A0A5E4MYV2_9HEMI|nr:Protoporphyrinogen oxidase,Amine oxidase,FAD/NAD(P)-binding domain [Cinara cedri]